MTINHLNRHVSKGFEFCDPLPTCWFAHCVTLTIDAKRVITLPTYLGSVQTIPGKYNFVG